jgi:hypothetical protein
VTEAVRPTIIFLDTETTSLDRRKRRIWDLAYIIRRPGEPDVERQFFMDVPLCHADPMSLKIGGFYERHPNPYDKIDNHRGITKTWKVVTTVSEDFHGAMIVGAVPSFDEETLAKLLRSWDLVPTWHYHLCDIESMAAGALKLQPPWDFDKVLAAYGLVYDEADRHTALGDARMVRALYDKVMGL